MLSDNEEACFLRCDMMSNKRLGLNRAAALATGASRDKYASTSHQPFLQLTRDTPNAEHGSKLLAGPDRHV